MPWGVAAAAVVGAYAASQQSKAAKNAAKTQAGSADQANATQLQMFNQQRADQAPFRDAGLVGLNQYMSMLGLGGGQAQPYGGAGGSSGGSYSGPSSAPQPLYQMVNGVPSVNQSLYNSDPAYAKAWDEIVQEHYNTFGKNFTKDSNASVIGSRLNQLYTPPKSGVGTAGYEKGTRINLGGGNTTAQPKTAQQLQQDAFAMFRNTPGYQFGLDEGNKQVQASAAARGGLNSGATLKALLKYGQNYADQQGYTPYMNRLAALSGMAQTSANQTGQAGQNYANQVGNNLQNAGQARAQGIYDSQNAWSNYANSMSSAIGNYYGRNS